VPLASVTGSITSAIGNHGLEAVFLLMMLGAILPTASELVMVYAGAVASGSVAGSIALFGHEFGSGASAFVAVAVTGAAGNAVGGLIGWAIGVYGGRPFVERHGRWLHVTPARLDRAERWSARFDTIAIPIGFATPLVRSFVAIPAGLARVRLAPFVVLMLLGVVPFCFGLAGAGWALGSHWERLHHALRYFELFVLVAAVAAGIAWLVLKRRSRIAAQGPGRQPE
jgi:membrane protein DedA with SNARE-associated domain